MKWSFGNIWNESLEQGKSERELKPRNRIWASELGGGFLDRYLKMKGIKPTNPPNARSKRKFEAGNMMEWIVGLVLKRVGILIDNQEWLGYQYPALLEVSGKFDYFAGGKPDLEKAKKLFKFMELPEFFGRAMEAIVNHLSEKYPEGLDKVILEVKSCSSFMMERYEKVGADIKHQLQSFHYLKAKNMPEAHIVYISKDDLRLLECGVYNPSETEKIYKEDIEKMTHYVMSNKEPPKEKCILFDDTTCKFSSNWKVAYSNYLTSLYGFENQKQYDDKYKPMISSFNRVLKRLVEDKKITEKNLAVMVDIKKEFSNFDEILVKAKNNKELLNDVEDE